MAKQKKNAYQFFPLILFTFPTYVENVRVEKIFALKNNFLSLIIVKEYVNLLFNTILLIYSPVFNISPR